MNMFESNVILDRYKTTNLHAIVRDMFESNVILDRYKTNLLMILYLSYV